MKNILKTIVLSLGLLVGIPAAQAAATPYCGITWGSGAKNSATTTTRPLTNIRTGQHACYDRMVFDLSGTTATGYNVSYVSNVYAEGSGKLIPISGGAKLLIVLRAPAYDKYGHTVYTATVGAKLPGVNLTGYQTFRDAKYAGSFEGQTSVGLGVRARLPFRVFTTGNHVVVDVAHKW
jgi:hypothetical protein